MTTQAPESGAVFTARDARQRRHLLWALGEALGDDAGPVVAQVAEQSYDGEDTSLYLWTFYDVGLSVGYRAGYRRGVDAGVHGTDARSVAARAKARQRRKRSKR